MWQLEGLRHPARVGRGVAMAIGFGSLTFAAAPQAQRGAAGLVTAIVGARLVDGTGAQPVNDSVILVSVDRITAAGRQQLGSWAP